MESRKASYVESPVETHIPLIWWPEEENKQTINPRRVDAYVHIPFQKQTVKIIGPNETRYGFISVM